DYNENRPVVSQEVFKNDELIRPDTNQETLSKLPTDFKADGTMTAESSAPLTDGTRFAVSMPGEKVKALGVETIARCVSFKAVDVDPKVMGSGPAYAIPKVLKQANLNVDDMDLVELNEAFASQTLASMRETGLDVEKTNVNGGAIALGYPLGATGAM